LSGVFYIRILLLKFGPHSIFEISLCKLDKIIVSIGSKCWFQKAKCIKNVNLHSSPHFVIIRALVLHHTCIGLCMYCDIQNIVVKSPQRPPLVAFCNVLLRYVFQLKLGHCVDHAKIMDIIIIVHNTWKLVFAWTNNF